MKLHRFWAIAIAVSVGALVGADAWADGIDATASESKSEADDGSVLVTDSDVTAVINKSTTATSGDAYSYTGTTVTSTSIDFEGEWTTADAYDSNATSEASVWFTADGSWDFELAGSVDFDGGPGSPLMILLLRDLTDNQILFYDDGETDVSGITGSLVDGNDYQFYYYASIWNNDADGNGDPNGNWTNLEGVGFASLDLARVVPEPASVALLGLGLGGFLLMRRRRAAV